MHASPALAGADPSGPRALVLSFVLSLAALTAASEAALAGDLELHFLEVDQGSATLVRGPGGVNVLIDGGFEGLGSATIVPYLLSIGVGSLAYSVATHWHTDHIGGMDEVFLAGYLPGVAAYDRGNFNIPNNSSVSSYLSAVGSKRAQPSVGQTLQLGGGAVLEFVAENGNFPGGSVNPWTGSQGENSASIAMVVRYGEFECWIGGDLTGGGSGTTDVESHVAPYVGRVEVVVGNHHGSSTSSSSVFAATLDPSFVVHSCGLDNPYGHPHQSVLDRWNSVTKSRVQWSTTAGDTTSALFGFVVADGHVVVTSDGNFFDATRVAGPERLRFATHELAVPAVGVGDLVVSEVLVDPLDTSDVFGEWLELAPLASGLRSLQGLRVESGPDVFTFASKLLALPGERHVFAVDGWGARNGSVFASSAAPGSTFVLSNGSSNLTLRSAGGSILETVLWGAGGFAVTPGASKERIHLGDPPAAANFADALTAWAGGDLGTPGEQNDNEVDLCGDATRYCVAAGNSFGLGTLIDYQGSLDVAANDFTLTAVDAPPGQFGIFYYGPSPVQIPFGNGFRCVGGGQLFRFPPVQVQGNGSVSYAVDFTDLANGGEIEDGSSWCFQFWYRDPMGGGAGFNLSDGLQATFCTDVPPIEEGDLVIGEFLANPTAVSDAQGEWFEVVNTRAYALDLTGSILEDGAGEFHVVGVLSIGAGERAVLGRSADTGANGGIPVDYAYGSAFELDDAADAIVLKTPAGMLIDRVDYDAFFFPVVAGRSCSLDRDVVDHLENDNSIHWCASNVLIGGGPDRGTPGLENEDCP